MPCLQAMWRGRTKDKIYPHRDRLRWVGSSRQTKRSAAGCCPCRAGDQADLCPHPNPLHALPTARVPHCCRRKFVECVNKAPPEEQALVSVTSPPVALQDTCDYRWASPLGPACCVVLCAFSTLHRLAQSGRGEWKALAAVAHLTATCGWPARRYNVYIESDAYASNMKQKLACGSLLVALKME